MAAPAYGFIGLGNMGVPMCGHLCAAGLPMTCFDAAGTAQRAPEGAEAADDLESLVRAADTIFLSLPDGAVVTSVAAEIAAVSDRRATTIVDFSTTGPEAAAAIGVSLNAAGMVFVDAPVSGGRSGAVAGTITVICAGPDEAVGALTAAFDAVGGNTFHVGPRPGQAQAMKLLNNFLSATAMAATSEATLFGAAHGLDMGTMIDVLNVSSGCNTATGDKFPNRIATGTFDAGFSTTLMSKDVNLFRDQVSQAGTANAVTEVIAALWRDADSTLPGSDFTEIYRFLSGR